MPAAGLRRGTMAWARSVVGWLGGFLLLPGELGGQGSRAGRFPGLGTRRRGVPKSRPRGRPERDPVRHGAQAGSPLAAAGGAHAELRCLDPGWTTITPSPQRGYRLSSRDTEAGWGHSCCQIPGVLTEVGFCERPRHSEVSVPTLGGQTPSPPQSSLPPSAPSSDGPAPRPHAFLFTPPHPDI